MEQLTGRRGFVTGAANGIGLGICRALARAGVDLAMADIDEAALARARDDVAAAGTRVIALPLEVSDSAAVLRAADEVSQALGELHILVNNAGVTIGGSPILDVTQEQWDWLFGVNLFGVLNGLRAFVPLIRKHGHGGHIVNTASIGGLQVNRELRNGPYAMTKYAVVALSEALEQDLEGSGIGVSVFCPALVETTLARSPSRRPARFGGPFERQAWYSPSAPLTPAISPDEAGERVLAAIRAGEFFVFSHEDPRAWIEARHRRIMDAFDRTARYLAGQASAPHPER